jgi:hypothetical protein
LRKIGATLDAKNGLMLREMRNRFLCDYRADPELQSMLRTSVKMAGELCAVPGHVESFAAKHF